MKIRTQQYLSACIAGALVLVIGVTLLTFSQRVSNAVVRNNLANDIVVAVSQLRFVMLEYILYHNERPRAQWQQRHDSLAKLLETDLYEGTAEEDIIRHLRQRHQQLKDAFNRLVQNYEISGSNPEEIALSQILAARLVEEIQEASQDFISDVLRLTRASDAEVAKAQNQESLLLIVFVALMGGMVVINLFLTRKQVLIPITRLAEGAAIVGAGNLGFRTGIASANEIGELSRAFDRMVAQMQQSRAELEQKTAQLAEANEELESFSYSVSHDLRAPLRAIDGFSQRLVAAYRDSLDATAIHYLDRIRAGTRVMAQLIEDLLSLSRVSRTKLHVQSVDLTAMTHRIAGELRRNEPQRAVELSVAGGAGVEGDERLLEIALHNLLGNAWKFTSKCAKASIECGVARQDGATVYFVRDNGAGFDMAYADKLFAPFQRLHNATEFPGTGIGLVIVRRIVHRHGGRVWADAKVNEGATFYFTLGKGEQHDDETDIAG